MKKRNKKKTGLIAIMLILVMLISIGYASISTNLTIGGNATITAQNWLIYFDHIQTTTGSVTPTTAPTTSGTSTTTLTWAVSLDTPGQFYEYTVDVVNAGSIDAMIGTLSNSTLTTDQAKYLDYTVTYSDGAEIEQYDKLDAGDTETLRVRVEFKADPEELPATASAITLNYASNYIQADTTHAKARNTVTPPAQPVSLEIGDSVSYSTTLNGQTLANWKVFYNDETNDLVYLILDDYLPGAAIPYTDESEDVRYNAESNSNLVLGDYDNREGFVTELSNRETFKSLLTGTLDGDTIDYRNDNTATAMGTPTLQLFALSWNEKYPSNQIYYSFNEPAEGEYTQIGDNYYAKGYYIGNTANPVGTTYVDFSSTSNYTSNDTLYFPHKASQSENGYYLSSLSAESPNEQLVKVEEDGIIGPFSIEQGGSIRPVICLPASAFE